MRESHDDSSVIEHPQVQAYLRHVAAVAAAVETDAQSERILVVENRLRKIEKQLDTLGSSWWKRILFRVNGWPPWWITNQPRTWRPWHWLTDHLSK